MIEYLQQLFAYNNWANHEVLTALRTTGKPMERSLKLLAHILAAEQLWLERLTQKKQTFPVWPDFSFEQCESQIGHLADLWGNYLKTMSEAELSEICNYANTKGEKWSNRKSDILTHVIMHSAYHRGQIAADTRAAGFTPAYTDFIHAIRQGELE